MKRTLSNITVTAIVADIVTLALLLLLYMRRYDYKMGIAIIIYVIVNALIMAIYYMDYLIKEEDFCYKHLSITQFTEVIPLKANKNDFNNSQTVYMAIIVPDEGIYIFIRNNNETTDILFEIVSFENFQKCYKIK